MKKRLSAILISALVLSGCGNPSTLQHTPIERTSIEFPLEVLGTEGYTVAVKIDVPKGSTAQRLWLQINNLSYDDKASVKVNEGDWIKLRNDTADLEAAGKAYGGIGGGYSTLRLSLPITGAVNGENTLRFRFN
jgi:hypothetical protein